MYFFPTAITGISVVLSIFLIAVSARTISRFKSPIFRYLLFVFILILFDSLYTIITILLLPNLRSSTVVVYIVSDLIILLLFYAVIARGR